MQKITDAITNLAEKMNNNIHLTIIKDTFIQIMPLTMIASFAFLGTILITSTDTGLASIDSLSFLSGFSIIFNTIYFAGLNLISLYTSFVMGQLYGDRNNTGGIITGLLSVMTYISISPIFQTVSLNGVDTIVSGILPSKVTNAQGLFLSMLVAFITSQLFAKFSRNEKLKIKLPESVPNNIFSAFYTLIPAFITVFTVALIGFIPVIISRTYLGDLIYQIIQMPLEKMANSMFGVIIITFASLVFWLVGIHGNQVISPIRAPITAAALATNVAAIAANQVPNQPFTMTFWFAFISLGGSGITISLIAAIMMFSKRADHKEIAKISLVPGIFGINEPIIFGLPIVLNPIFALPFILSGCLSAVIALVAHNIGFLTASAISIPFGLPILASGFVGYGFNGVIVQIVILAISFLIYIPFVKISNKETTNEI